jgi:CpXC protein
MTLPASSTTRCANCGYAFDVALFSSINVTVNPELKQRLLNYELTDTQCPRCGSHGGIDFEVLYHDMANQLMIWLRHEDVGSDRPRNVEPIAQDIAGVLKDVKAYKFRIVRDIHELIEKIRVFDDKHDDFRLEFYKLGLAFEKQIPSTTPILYAKTTQSLFGFGTKQLTFVTPSAVGDGEDIYEIGMPRQTKELANIIELIKTFCSANGRWVYLSREVILDALKQAGLVREVFPR